MPGNHGKTNVARHGQIYYCMCKLYGMKFLSYMFPKNEAMKWAGYETGHETAAAGDGARDMGTYGPDTMGSKYDRGACSGGGRGDGRPNHGRHNTIYTDASGAAGAINRRL